ncbi:MAG TPA: type II toxin-antitoxin system RelE/ParE family toxin [Caulobacteraceae bacterium]|nr:type II toxin-antitoxin system RelE/ParE family toxin [Caulobacteraceae bacterium]
MRRKLAYAPEAVDDLDSIQAYSERDSPRAAARFVEQVRARCRALAGMPFVGRDAGQVFPGAFLLPYRKRVVLVYTVDASSVEIRRILYGGRDLASALRSGVL